MHSLETEQGWLDYAKATRNSPNKAEAFTMGWANLNRYHPEYDHHDRERFLAVFSYGRSFAVDTQTQREDFMTLSPGDEVCANCGADLVAHHWRNLRCPGDRKSIYLAKSPTSGKENTMTPNEKPLQPHQQRVVDERIELNFKLDRLTAFLKGNLFRTLPDDEQERMNRQWQIMSNYSGVLAERIVHFE